MTRVRVRFMGIMPLSTIFQLFCGRQIGAYDKVFSRYNLM
jgi:hypothetical protein